MIRRLCVFALFVLASACSTSSDQQINPYCSSTANSTPGNNVLPVCVGSNYINEITVSVTICQPGTSNCETIPNVLLDTGSNGLRLFKSVVGLSLNSVSTAGGNTLAECVTYADTSSHWGPVKIADVMLGGEKAPNVPIEIIDGSFSAVPSSCTNLETDPAHTGYNGIVGVGLLTQDCGSTCTTTTTGSYYSCSSTTCTDSTATLAQQVTNPVSLMPIDNNGVILTLPNVGNGGVASVNGTMTLGIGTSSNNAPVGTPQIFPSSPSVNFKTTFLTHSYAHSFIDSGSNALYFPGVSSLQQCSSGSNTFYCPASPTTLNATQAGNTGTTTNVVSFTIESAQNLINSNNRAVSTFGGVINGGFDWGLPFFFNRTVYVGISGASALGTTGPFWAY